MPSESEYSSLDWEQRIRELVDTAPPLTSTQRDLFVSLLRPAHRLPVVRPCGHGRPAAGAESPTTGTTSAMVDPLTIGSPSEVDPWPDHRARGDGADGGGHAA